MVTAGSVATALSVALSFSLQHTCTLTYIHTYTLSNAHTYRPNGRDKHWTCSQVCTCIKIEDIDKHMLAVWF